MKNITIKQSGDIFIKALVVNDYSQNTINTYKTDFNTFYEFIKQELDNCVRNVQSIRYHHLDLYKEYLISRYAYNSASRKFNCLRTYFNIMLRNEFISSDIPDSLKGDNFGNKKKDKRNNISNIRKQILPQEALTEILRRINADKSKNKYRDLALFNILFMGLRRSEVLCLRWENVDFVNKTLSIWRSKNSTFDTVLLSDSAFTALKQHYKMSMSTNTLNERIFNMSTTPYNNVLHKYTAGLKTETGNDKIVGHMLRHTFITNMVRANMPLAIIQQFVGTTVESLQEYTHLSIRDSYKAVSVLDSILNT